MSQHLLLTLPLPMMINRRHNKHRTNIIFIQETFPAFHIVILLHVGVNGKVERSSVPVPICHLYLNGNHYKWHALESVAPFYATMLYNFSLGMNFIACLTPKSPSTSSAPP